MSEDYGNDIIHISDEEGNNYVLEHIDTIEVDGEFYLAFVTADKEEDDECYGIVILQAADDGDLLRIEDEDLLQALYDIFTERLFDDEDDEFEED